MGGRSIAMSLAGCALALGLGVVLARVVPFPFPATGSSSSGGARSSASGAGISTGSASVPASLPWNPAAPELAETLRTATGAQRWLTMLAAADKATAEDMPGLVRVAGEDSAMIRMLAARWAELDPQHMFRWVFTDLLLPEGSRDALPGRWALTEVLFDEWTKSDLPAVAKALTDVPNFPGRDNLRMTVSNDAMKTDVERGLRLIKEWGIHHYLPDMSKVGEWAARDPRHATEVVAALALGADGGAMIEHVTLTEIGKAWAQIDPRAALEFAATMQSFGRFALAGEAVQEWAKKDLGAAVEFATAQGDPTFRASLAQGLVGEWAKTDAAGALAWSNENLRGAARTEVIGDLITAAAGKNLEAAAELVAGMEAGPAQNRACASIFETWFKNGKEGRDAAFTWLAALPDASARTAALERVQWGWMSREPDAVRDFVSGPFGQMASSSMLQSVARSQTSKNPEAAMQWAASLPAERSGDVRRAVLENWLNVRPEGAMNFARALPAGVERNDAIRTVSQALASSPERLEKWLKQLPRGDRSLAK